MLFFLGLLLGVTISFIFAMTQLSKLELLRGELAGLVNDFQKIKAKLKL